MIDLQKYYKLFLLLTFCSFFCSNCGFPYHTKQARDARKALKIAKQQQRQVTTLVVEDSTDSTNSVTVTTDSIPKVNSNPTPTPSSENNIVQATEKVNTDTLTGAIDTLPPLGNLEQAEDSTRIFLTDSLEVTPDSSIFPKKKVILLSKDSLTMPVQYEAKDSMIYDIIARKVYMYGNAGVFYEQYELKAGYIEFDFKTNIAMATCLIDSAGNEIECPIFDDKTQKFESRRIEFNFKTKKGKVYDASTKQGDGFLVSNATKFISKDSGSVEDIIYSQGCVYTTCDHPYPHFGIRASKAKIIPNKLIVVGPSFVEIMGSPTPIILPFGFFPLTKSKRSGLILSPNLDFSPTLGPGLRGNGFYLGLSEFWDLKVTGDFYMRGSIRGYLQSNYNIRYKGSGSVNIGYTRLVNDEKNTPNYSLTQSFNFSWTHSQSPQAHPSQSFSASINFGTSDYYRNTFNDANNVLQATLNSSVGYTKRFLGTPFSLSARVSHSQNTQTGLMTIVLPQLTVSMNQVFPFKRKNTVGRPKWYERIGFSYSMNARNTITTLDSTFFTQQGFQDAIDNMNYDIIHSPNLSMSFKVLKHINIQPSVSYQQRWYFYKNKQLLDPTPVIDTGSLDTTAFGTIEKYRDYGFYTTHQFSAGINANTQIYATGLFNIGALHQVRAQFTPNIGFSWTPNYENARDYYFDSVQYDTRYPDNLRQYNHFSYTPPSGRTALLTYALNARFEAKVKRGKRDTLNKDPYKKIILLPNVTINGNYNIAADSLHLSPLNFNTYTTLFKKLSVRFSAVFDPYAANTETNTRINTFEYAVSKRLLRVTSMSFNASTNITAADLRNLFRPKDAPVDNSKKQFDLIRNINLGYQLTANNRYFAGVDSTVIVANQLTVSGTINLSKGWEIVIGRIGYDFSANRITYPDFRIRRDLHCWRFELGWQPERRTWSFSLKVKPGSLDFLSPPDVRKEFFDAF